MLHTHNRGRGFRSKLRLLVVPVRTLSGGLVAEMGRLLLASQEEGRLVEEGGAGVQSRERALGQG